MVSIDVNDVLQIPDHLISEEPPTRTEVWEAISMLKGCKAVGPCLSLSVP